MARTKSGNAQHDQIKAHLHSKGSISAVEAAALYKTRSLSKRICELKAMGEHISSTRQVDVTGQRYVRYFGFNVGDKIILASINPNTMSDGIDVDQIGKRGVITGFYDKTAALLKMNDGSNEWVADLGDLKRVPKRTPKAQ